MIRLYFMFEKRITTQTIVISVFLFVQYIHKAQLVYLLDELIYIFTQHVSLAN